jgi:DNA-binding PucR family transcriptional regulator
MNSLLLAYVPEFEQGRAIFDTVEKELIRRISISIKKPFAYTRSERCQFINDFASAFARCRGTLLLARRFGKVGLVREGDFGAFPLLLASANQSPTKSFVVSMLQPIEKYDRANSTDLLNTVKEFVDSGRKFQASARALGIHLSTLRYRIGRVKEVFGVDLEDAEVAFNFALAFHIKALAGLYDEAEGQGRRN